MEIPISIYCSTFHWPKYKWYIRPKPLNNENNLKFERQNLDCYLYENFPSTDWYNVLSTLYNNVLKQGYIYRPPMKLGEGNVFTHVCLSVHRGEGLHLTVAHDVLDFPLQAPTSDMGPQSQPPTSDTLWPSLETCSNLFTWGCPPPQQHWHMVATKVHMVDQEAVRILLQCFLVFLFDCTSQCQTLKNVFGWLD